MRILLISTARILAGVLALPGASLADPIHAIENDAYWHHDSGWIFLARLGEFQRDGAAQDVAGSHDAVAHYVRTLPGMRVVVAVDVFPVDSAAEQTTLQSARAALLSEVQGAGQLAEGTLPVGKALNVARLRFTASGDAASEALYFASVGAWRVRIRARVPAAARQVLDELDGFVEAQRWDTLP